ncbi:MAG: UDP-N-acetylglucosamine--N-acetylmuramyl-(pentapeptide) pyrophosphoryl-undecaprenol N-acetylglucosamine transferase [Gemmatimonadetes bacterium]|nr:UDP-N-acetylglucosamine--N-acetylmuramyl-(pentapeptide) pyrophosphoryl-undecaprenol N-acetylglucosamine transferase [Gemmatimonadota bacterium]
MHESRHVVLFAGGGTGGHLYPALALAEALTSVHPGVRPFFVGAQRGVEARILPERGAEHLLLPIRGLDRRAGIVGNLGVGAALVRSMARLADEFQRLRPELVVVTGGYAGAPAGLMAALTRVPLALQEQNAHAGVTTRLLARFADQIHVAFPEAADGLSARARRVVEHTGNPVRPPSDDDRVRGRAAFALSDTLPVVLVTGASQGSAALNAAVLELVAARSTEPPTVQFLWSTGPSHIDGVRASLAELGDPPWVRALGYIDDMPAALAVADVAVGRAGAMTTSEFLAWGLPAIIVPLPTAAADHQTRNAAALAAAGTSVHLPETELDGGRLGSELDALFEDDARRDAMTTAALVRARPDGARDIARRLATLLPGVRGGGS